MVWPCTHHVGKQILYHVHECITTVYTPSIPHKVAVWTTKFNVLGENQFIKQWLVTSRWPWCMLLQSRWLNSLLVRVARCCWFLHKKLKEATHNTLSRCVWVYISLNGKFSFRWQLNACTFLSAHGTFIFASALHLMCDHSVPTPMKYLGSKSIALPFLNN